MRDNEIDRATAYALVDAGYMPLAEYVRLFGADDEAPSTAPSLDEMDVHRAPQKPSVFSHLLDLFHPR